MFDFLSKNIFEISGYKVTYIQLIWAIVIWLFFIVFYNILKRILIKSKRIDVGSRFALLQIVKYFLVVILLVVTLDLFGVNVSVLLAGSAALLVGIGLGLQNLFNDFVSGIIILLDGTVKVGDLIEVDGMLCRVEKITLRTTMVVARDDKHVILPNSAITNKSLINWTHHQDRVARFDLVVGVAYGSDVELVTKILSESAVKHPEVDVTKPPFVRFHDFGDSALIFHLFFWTDNVYRVDNVKSDLRYTIDKEFRKNNITIPFPQRTVHLPPTSK